MGFAALYPSYGLADKLWAISDIVQMLEDRERAK
jgi:hypothetical protein